jgi:hypothetical protein
MLPTKIGSSSDHPECCRQKSAAHPALGNVADRNRQLIRPSGMSPTEIGGPTYPPERRLQRMPAIPLRSGYCFFHYSRFETPGILYSFSLITTKSYMLSLLSHVGRFANF